MADEEKITTASSEYCYSNASSTENPKIYNLTAAMEIIGFPSNHLKKIKKGKVYVKEMVAQGFTVDLNKPLVFQVEEYQEWIHKPIVCKESPRFFENDIVEFLTKNQWWYVPLIWLPVVGWFLSWSLSRGNTLHDLLHSCHHKHPMDGLRLVFPPAATAILFYPKYHLNHRSLPCP